MTVETRPEPEALLAEAEREGRGRLKIFLGAAPGVGKTYAMLEAARLRAGDGTDVVAGVVETHGRAETERLLTGLQVLPRARLEYGGRMLAEMDLDALLARHPQLALVDELAHTNVLGSRHPKRWQDVEELLAAGIDVYTTLNVQHLESLNDVVARIARVKVRETVPDKVLELADEIELVDLPPQELIERLREGKVYVPEQIARAIQNFFSKGNLTALRELAMRVAADRVDAQMTAHMRLHAIPGPWPTQERVLVCVNEAPVGKALVRAGKRIAERARADWIVVSVATPQAEQLTDQAKDAIADGLRLAETLGAEVATVTAEGRVVDAILDYARSRNVSRIVLGRPRGRRLAASLFRESVAQEIIRKAVDFEVTIVSADPEEARKSLIGLPRPEPERDPKAYLWATLAVAACGGVAMLVNTIFPVESLSLFFLVGVLAVASRFGLWPSVYASVLSFLTYNFFLTEPYFTFEVAQRNVLLALFLFLLVAVVTGNLAARLRTQAKAQRAIARRTANLFEFSRKVASVASLDDVIWAAVHHVSSTLQCASLILMPDAASGRLTIVGGYPPEDQLEPRDWGAAEWAWEKGEPAGWSSPTLPSASWLFLPMKTAQHRRGLLGVRFGKQQYITTDERRLLEALVDQVAVAIERTELAADMEETRLLSETESLRTALLSSVSHDLRTPLVSIIGAATSLLEPGVALGDAGRRAMAETIRDEGERLNRYIQNLLDMTRLGHGALKIGDEAVDLREVVGRAERRLEHALAGHRVVHRLAGDLPDVRGDAILLEQVVANILDNAAKYAPDGSAITVAARAVPEACQPVDFRRGAGYPGSGPRQGLRHVLPCPGGRRPAGRNRPRAGDRQGHRGGPWRQGGDWRGPDQRHGHRDHHHPASGPGPGREGRRVMSAGRILVIEDDPPIRKFLRVALEAHQFEVVEAASGRDGLGKVATVSPDLVILDLGLPDMDGKEIVKNVRGWAQVPILILSVRQAEGEKVAALDAGANDYVVKPFGIGELLARIRALLRTARAAAGETSAELRRGDLIIDLARHEVHLKGEPLKLTRKEFDLLALLARNSGRIVTHKQLLHDIWGPAHEHDVQYLRVFIGRLRGKLGDDPAEPTFILNEPGVGYRFLPE